MFEASPEPRQLEIVDSGAHSSGLVIGAHPDVVEHTRADRRIQRGARLAAARIQTAPCVPSPLRR